MTVNCLLCTSNDHDTRDCPHREGTCSMCGQPYRSYVGHLQDCTGGK